MAALTWREVRVFLEKTDEELIAELTQVRSMLHTAERGGDWSPAQVVDHLVRTEKLLYLIFTLIPKLRRFPRILQAADKADAWLWRTLGLRTVESPGAKLTPANATEGRFIAPLFLRPPRRARDFDELIAWRRRTREADVANDFIARRTDDEYAYLEPPVTGNLHADGVRAIPGDTRTSPSAADPPDW